MNAHYIAARGASFLNVIDQISVVAVGNDQQCRQISVNLDTCIPQINGMELPLVSGRRGPYNSDGINIRVYRNRVRIAVPNCADTMLVMWVTCQNLDLENPIDGSMLRNISMIKYVVSRGLNLQEFSHGLLGKLCSKYATCFGLEVHYLRQCLGIYIVQFVMSVLQRVTVLLLNLTISTIIIVVPYGHSSSLPMYTTAL